MDNFPYILPIPEEFPLSTNEYSVSDLIIANTDSVITPQNKSIVFKNLYFALFTDKVDYDTIHGNLSIILDQILKSDKLEEYSVIIGYILMIELLCENFYHKLKSSINEKFVKKYKIKILDLKYPNLHRENSLNLDPLIAEIFKSEFLCKALANLIICYKINSEYSKENIETDDISGFDLISLKNIFTEKVTIDDKLLISNNPPFLLLFLINLEHRKYLSYILQDKFRSLNHSYYFFDDVDLELIYDGTIGELGFNDKFQILKQYPSHMLINKYYEDLKYQDEIDNIIIRAYTNENPDTIDLIHKIFEFDAERGEKILKRIILLYKEKKFKSMFFTKCNNIDIEFIEIFMLYIDNISGVNNELFINIISSPYFGILSNDINIFKECIDRSLKIIDKIKIHEIIDSIFYEKMRIKEENILKMEYLLLKFPDTKEYLFLKFESILQRLEQSYTSNIEQSDTLLSTESSISINNSPNFKVYIYKVINLLRSESGILKYTEFILNYDFLLFLDHCLLNRFDLIDLFFVEFLNKILLSGDKKKYNLLPIRFVEYIIAVKNIDYYWNTAAMKKICLEKLLEFIKDTKQDEEFYIKSIYNEKDLMKLLDEKISVSCDEKNYIAIEQIFKKLETYSSHQTGMVFHNSFIKFNVENKSFCLYFTAIQYDSANDQSLIKFEGDNTSVELLIIDGKIIKKTTQNGSIEKILLNSEVFTGGKIYIGFKYSKKTLKAMLNSNKYAIHIKLIKRITIGSYFKGTIQKIIWYENNHFRNEYLLHTHKSYYYFDILCELEKKLLFRNENGFYIYNSVTYFFNEEFEVQIVNVLYNYSLKWIYNFNLCDKIFNESKSNEKFAEIMILYGELAYLDLKHKR